jgi:hypothetical protein
LCGDIRLREFLAFGVFNESLGTEHADNLENKNFTRSMKLKGKRVVTPGWSIKDSCSGFEEGG